MAANAVMLINCLAHKYLVFNVKDCCEFCKFIILYGSDAPSPTGKCIGISGGLIVQHRLKLGLNSYLCVDC